jgi:uncharacterized membrane protein
MRKITIISLLVIFAFILTACAPGFNSMEDKANSEGEVAGFWQGLWHGFIAFFTLVISLFNENVNIYEVHNNGGWYNFGFILGVSIFFGGGGRGSQAVKK